VSGLCQIGEETGARTGPQFWVFPSQTDTTVSVCHGCVTDVSRIPQCLCGPQFVQCCQAGASALQLCSRLETTELSVCALYLEHGHRDSHCVLGAQSRPKVDQRLLTISHFSCKGDVSMPDQALSCTLLLYLHTRCGYAGKSVVGLAL